ncbi:Hypothetical predicted protein, partial [Pelobates cultripes]
ANIGKQASIGNENEALRHFLILVKVLERCRSLNDCEIVIYPERCVCLSSKKPLVQRKREEENINIEQTR